MPRRLGRKLRPALAVIGLEGDAVDLLEPLPRRPGPAIRIPARYGVFEEKHILTAILDMDSGASVQRSVKLGPSIGRKRHNEGHAVAGIATTRRVADHDRRGADDGHFVDGDDRILPHVLAVDLQLRLRHFADDFDLVAEHRHLETGSLCAKREGEKSRCPQTGCRSHLIPIRRLSPRGLWRDVTFLTSRKLHFRHKPV
jgi:hypothetical protein